MISVIQRKTGKLLGHFQPHGKFIYGHHWIMVYAIEGYNGKIAFTSVTFRFQFIHNVWWSTHNIRVIAYGYRDANLLPGFVEVK